MSERDGRVAGLARLVALCAEDEAALRGLRDGRQVAMKRAETAVSQEMDGLIKRTAGLTRADVAADLRNRLGRIEGVPALRGGPTPAPRSLAEAVEEWNRLRDETGRAVHDTERAFEAWSRRIFRSAKSRPRVHEDLWRAVDRLERVQRSVPALRTAVISDAVRAAAAAHDAEVRAETQRRESGQDRLAAEVREEIGEVEARLGLPGVSWDDVRWQDPTAATRVDHLVRLGEVEFDLPARLGLSRIPAWVGFPFAAGVAIGASFANRDRALGLAKSLLLRLLAAVPPGGLQIKVVDPVALGQSVAEFRHLAEYDATLMDEKTWTGERDVERLMDDLTEHLEVVISTYLRGQFDTIDHYNEHAGEVAEPYRVVTVFDYPNGFSERASQKLLSLVENGPRCGVHVLLLHGPDETGVHGVVDVDRLTHGMRRITVDGDHARLREPDGLVTLHPDVAPPVSFDRDGHARTPAAALLTAIGETTRLRQANPPAVTLGTLLPVLDRSRSAVRPAFAASAGPLTTDSRSWWTATTAPDAVALLGRSGAQGVAAMRFSSTEVAGGAIMVGLPRSGKTTSLHAMILSLAMSYSPEELELHLIDAKHGVEFTAYRDLPHARMVSVHSDREFSLAVLQSVDREIRARAEQMKAASSVNITEFRQRTGRTMSRVVVVIDEFHEIFEEPDDIGQQAFAAFSNIARMGPFSGVHVVLASQTLSSMPAMDRQTLLLLPQRVAFMCNEYDSEIVMGDTNKATRLLSRTGEGLFNPARGAASQNQPFQGLYVPAEERTEIVRALGRKAAETGWTRTPRVFDGAEVAARPAAVPAPGRALVMPVGEPFSLEAAATVTLRRNRGAGVLVLGDTDDDLTDSAIRAVVHSAVLAAAAQEVEVTVVDFLGDEEPRAGLTVEEVAAAAGAGYVRSRGLPGVLARLASEVADRLARSDYRAPGRLLVLLGLQRAVDLTPPDPYAATQEGVAALLAALLVDGPEVGVHTLISADRLKSVEARLGGDSPRELAWRVLGSEADQSDLLNATGSYGNAPIVQAGQLLIADAVKGRSHRVRGYGPLTAQEGPTP